LRYLSNLNVNKDEIKKFIEIKFKEFESNIESNKKEIIKGFEDNKSYPINDLKEDFQSLLNEYNKTIIELREKVNLFIEPAFKLIQLIRFIVYDFYEKSIKKMDKIKDFYINIENKGYFNEYKFDISRFSDKVIRKIEKIDKDLEKLFNLFPFQIEMQFLVILTREWTEKKNEILNRLNQITVKKKYYKCEIMHELLDPEVDEIWRCSNCGTIVCGEHLEKWYYKKKSPECFKCGKIGTFELISKFKE